MKMERIVWLDHSGAADNRWCDKEEFNEVLRPVKIKTVGFLYEETEEYVVLLQNISAEDQYCNYMLILKSCIIKREKLVTLTVKELAKKHAGYNLEE